MLDINLSTIIWEVVNFLLIAVALYYLVFKPMAKRAEKRAQEKAEMMLELKEDREKAAVKLQEIETRLANLDAEIEKIADDAYQKSKRLQDDLLKATREDADRIMLEAVKEARKEQYVDLRKNQEKVVDAILRITANALDQVITPQVHDSLIEELNAKIWNLGKDDMRMVQTIRDSLAERTPTILLSVAEPLGKDQQMKMLGTFNALADKDIDLQVEIKPELIAGIKARVGDIVLDNSLLAHLEAMRDDINQMLEKIDSENYD